MRKKRNELRLGGVQRALAGGKNVFLINLERELRRERSTILLQEEMLWLQKSWIEWLKSGDSNTKFFHTSTVVRRRRNRIHCLKDNDGNWVEDKDELRAMAVDYYTRLFKSNGHVSVPFISGSFPDTLLGQREFWEADVTVEETKDALQGMSSWKAPGSDGFQPGFFKKTWDITGRDVH